MRIFVLAAAVVLAGLALAGMAAPAWADVQVEISIPTQTMRVVVDGNETYVWSVSTARRGYRTVRGNFNPYWLDANHHSAKYGGAPMPYSVFFHGDYAIHGTAEVGSLGRPASHGCVRLHPANAQILYQLVQQVGYGNTHITIH